MDSTSVYGLELLVLEGTGGKALATDHRGLSEKLTHLHEDKLNFRVSLPRIELFGGGKWYNGSSSNIT